MSITVNTDLRTSFQALGSNAPSDLDSFHTKLNKISRPLRQIANAIGDTTLIKKVDAFASTKINLQNLDKDVFPKTLGTINAIEAQAFRNKLQDSSLALPVADMSLGHEFAFGW